MLTLVLVSHGLCLNGRPHPSLGSATAARTCGLRSGRAALCGDGGRFESQVQSRAQVQGRPLRQAAEGEMTDDLEVLDVEIGGETPADFTAMGILRARVAANLASMNITAPNALQVSHPHPHPDPDPDPHPRPHSHPHPNLIPHPNHHP